MSLFKTIFGFNAATSLERAEKYEKLGKLDMARLELEEALSNLPPGEREFRETINSRLDRIVRQESEDSLAQAENALAHGEVRRARFYLNVAQARQAEGTPEYQAIQEKLNKLPQDLEEAGIEDELDSMLRAEVGINFLDRQRKLEFWKSGFPPYKEEYYLKKALTSEVVQAQVREVQERPDDPDACFNLGVTLAQLGLVIRALEQIRHFLELRPDDREGLYLLAHLLSDDGQEAESIRIFEKVISLDPEFLEAYYYLGIVYVRLGDEFRARQLFQQIIKKGEGTELAEEAQTQLDEMAGETKPIE
jgi:tetratricopeptide (TPR) repeat protein